MQPETIKAVADALTPLADKIGKGGEYVFSLAVRQAYISGITDIVYVAAAILVGVFVILPWLSKLTNGDWKRKMHLFIDALCETV